MWQGVELKDEVDQVNCAVVTALQMFAAFFDNGTFQEISVQL